MVVVVVVVAFARPDAGDVAVASGASRASVIGTRRQWGRRGWELWRLRGRWWWRAHVEAPRGDGGGGGGGRVSRSETRAAEVAASPVASGDGVIVVRRRQGRRGWG